MYLTINQLEYSYSGKGKFHLGPLTLSFHTNETTALVGSNGSGKTTLIKILLQQLVQFSGEYCIDTMSVRDVTGSVMHRFGIGYAPEFPVLDEKLTGLEIMHVIREIYSLETDAFNERLKQLKAHLQVENWFETSPCSDYSQGMRKKVSLIIAFLSAKRYLIIDEPTNGLDPLAIFGLKKLLLQYTGEGMGVLVSSHMLDFVEKVATSIIILRGGLQVFVGRVTSLLEQHSGKQLDEIYYDMFTSGAEIRESRE
ncbi:MAG: ABC transporter ATP-binding protein [Chitinispirillaceae bacterium]|nr:ABC transporter ATP-binding protein [Chitinispirillaceae bacterium]